MTDAAKAKLITISRDTLLPLGGVAVLLVATYWFATERAQVLSRITVNETVNADQDEEIAGLGDKLDALAEAIHRVEVELGTAPK